MRGRGNARQSTGRGRQGRGWYICFNIWCVVGILSRSWEEYNVFSVGSRHIWTESQLHIQYRDLSCEYISSPSPWSMKTYLSEHTGEWLAKRWRNQCIGDALEIRNWLMWRVMLRYKLTRYRAFTNIYSYTSNTGILVDFIRSSNIQATYREQIVFRILAWM